MNPEGTKRQDAKGGSKGKNAKQDKSEPKQKQGKSGGGKGKQKNQKKKGGGFGGLTVEQLESKIENLETKVAAIEAQLADPETYRDNTLFSELQASHEKLKGELEPLEAEWAWRG